MTTADLINVRRKVTMSLCAAIPIDQSQLADFVEGRRDHMLTEFDIDSLGLMELSVALELSSGIALTPEDLQLAGSLDAIATLIASQR
jgi:acyl carrier protein